MTRLGGSRSLADQWTYVQATPPTDEREGVQWINTADDNKAYSYSTEYSDWLRQVRVWAQDTQPDPRVGPLDGDQWIDTSQSSRPTMIYSADAADWIEATDVAWGDVTSKPTVFGSDSTAEAVTDATWGDVTSKPTVFGPNGGESVTGVSWSDVGSKPSSTANTGISGGYHSSKTKNKTATTSSSGATDTAVADHTAYISDGARVDITVNQYHDLDYVRVIDEGGTTLVNDDNLGISDQTYSQEYTFSEAKVTVEFQVTATAAYSGVETSGDSTPHIPSVPSHSHSL